MSDTNELFTFVRYNPRWRRPTITIKRDDHANFVAKFAGTLNVIPVGDNMFFIKRDAESTMQLIEDALRHLEQ